MEFSTFRTEKHLRGVLRLCEAEGWPSMPADPDQAVRALTAPGVLTVVAVADEEVVGFAQMLTDGEIQAYLCNMAVYAPGAVRESVGGSSKRRSGVQVRPGLIFSL